MNIESLKNKPLDQITDEEIEIVAASFALDILNDFQQHPFDASHPVWQRLRFTQQLLAPSKTVEEMRQMVLDTFTDDGQIINNQALRQIIMEGLGILQTLPSDGIVENNDDKSDS